MKEILAQLAQLAEVDSAAHTLRDQLWRFPKLLKELDAKEQTARKKIDAAKAAHTAARERRRKSELEAASQREQIRKYTAQQNQVRTNKEFEAIKHELELVNGKIDEAELSGMEALEAEEKSEHDIKLAEAALEKLLAELTIERERIAGRTAEKKSELKGLDSERGERIARLPEDVREEYELLQERFPGSAAVRVREGSCGGCNTRLVAQRILDARKGQSLVHCDQCRRILFDPETLA